jgi:hypothetical protein
LNNRPKSIIDVHTWDEPGYKPLVFSHDWQVALLNADANCLLENLGRIERHNQTDEVFILSHGQSALLVTNETEELLIDMQPGVIYNVPRAIWHTLLSSPDATWIIVENHNTHLNDNDVRQMTTIEKEHFLAQLPDWLK